MTNNVAMMIGSYPFMVKTAVYNEMKITASWRWTVQDRIGTKGAPQFVGSDPRKISLSGMILPHFSGGMHQIDLMRISGDTHKPLPLIDGMGWLWGDYVITRIEETRSALMSDGAPRRQDFTMDLLEYPDSRFNPIGAAISAASNIARLF
ncbi:phage tail protein [Paracoccaceae bacterium GXU_MW_L88]